MARRRPPRGAGEGLLRPTAQPKGVLGLDDMIAALVELDANGLCLQWRNHLGGTPPAHLPRWLLMKILAYRIQATAFSGLDKETLRVLRQPKGRRLGSPDLHPFEARIATTREGTQAEGRGSARPRVEWQDRACDDPRQRLRLEWRDLRQPIASRQGDDRHRAGTAIASSACERPRSDRSTMIHRRSGDCDAASSGACLTPIKDGGAAFARRPNRQAASP